MSKLKFNGKWLNLAAGDGRYNSILLKNSDLVIATDIDKNALKKLKENTPTPYKKKLEIKTQNFLKKFPFNNKQFDGVFCAGTLHLFPKNEVRKVFKEIDRVLKPNGKLVMDFAAEIKRELPNGKKLKIIKGEKQYSLKEAVGFLKNSFRDYETRIFKCKVPKEKISNGKSEYTFECNYALLTAKKHQ